MDEELTSLLQADLDDKVRAGRPCMLLKETHKVGLTIADEIGHKFNGQVFLIVIVDVVDNLPDLGIFPIGVVRDFFEDMAVQKEEVEELVSFCLEKQFKVPSLFLG